MKNIDFATSTHSETIICTRDYTVTNDVIIVDRSNEEDTSGLPHNIFRTRTKN